MRTDFLWSATVSQFNRQTVLLISLQLENILPYGIIAKLLLTLSSCSELILSVRNRVFSHFSKELCTNSLNLQLKIEEIQWANNEFFSEQNISKKSKLKDIKLARNRKLIQGKQAAFGVVSKLNCLVVL